ncbi:MAG TPA: sigma-70 family RNA polymerase sigma factor [Polyangiaceae bacterium]|nr:sigma-70 family RNA polymerase sigma factor [Polyangiaceae bacterium]
MAPLEDPPDVASASDAELAERARRGDRAAFGELYDRLAPALFRVATSFFRDEARASDLVHDVFLEAWEHVREYDAARAPFRTWLLLRLRSRALDRLGRAEARLTEPLDEPAMERRHTGAPDADSRLAVRCALRSLEADVRAVLERRYVGGLTAREIAESDGIPIGTVKSRLSRGLASLSVTLRDEEERG